MSRLALALLGPLEISRDGRPLALPYDKVRALLVYLAAEPQRRHARATVADLLWPDQHGPAARHSLCQAVMSLRHALGEDAGALLAVTRQDISFLPEPDTSIDYLLVSQLLTACDRHPHLHTNPHTQPHTQPPPHAPLQAQPIPADARAPAADDCAECARHRARVAELYRGPFLADLHLASLAPGDASPFAEWAAGIRGWLHERVGRAVSTLAAYCERHGDDTHALAYAWRQIEIDPLCEDGHRRVMRRLAAAGDRGAALAHYARCRQRLAADADLEPEPETTALYEQIRLRGRAAGA
jgi:DNA-binding SARP family transcriptional activator